MTPELKKRLTLGPLLAIAVTAAVAYAHPDLGRPGVALLALIAVILGSREYVRLARAAAPGLTLLPVLVPNLLLVLLPGAERFHLLPPGVFTLGDWAVLVVGAALGWALLEQMFRRGPDGIFAHVGATMLGIAYLGIPFLMLQQLAALDRGAQLLLVLIAAVKFGDVTAFAGGKLLGRHKLCPSISPGKTWEGFACSFIGAIGGSYLFAWLPTTWGAAPAFAGWWQPAVWGLILGPLGVLGDLAESCMKRAAGQKDAGTALPGFGGLLDLLDALIIAAPVACLLGRLL